MSFSPQARGRSERANGTLQGRLVNELHLADLTTVAAANAYLTERFIADYNDEFARPPADPTSAFVPLHGVELDRIPREPAPGLNAASLGSEPAYSRYFKQIAKAVVLPRP